LGLLELAPNGKAHLIPITILIDGKYYDASAYKAAPVPMALWSDTVYEAVRTGVSMGLFTVTGALQRKNGNDATAWMAEGTWQTASSIKAKVAKKPVSSTPRGMNEDEGPPVLRRAGDDKSKPADPPASTTPAQAQPAPAGSQSTSPASTEQPTPAPTASTPPAPATPSQPEQAQEDKAPEDKDRPSLKRGQAGAASAEEAQKKAMAAASAKAAGHAATALSTGAATSSGASSTGQSGAQASDQMQLIPAISDSNGPDPLPYTYSLKPEEEQQFRKKMLAMAGDEIRARAAGSTSVGTAQPVHAASQHAKAPTAKPVQPTFADVQLRVFDLADINEPELVLTARARMPQRPRENETDLEYIITLVVREDVNGDLHKALANVTDTRHLDVIPQLDLIDAVDVDGDGRAELLFRQVSEAGSAFVVYRVIGDRLYPLFQGAPGQ